MIEARLTDSNFHELGILKIASPCAEPWESMRGDLRVRHCELCKLNVYNLAEMTTEEARQLIRRRSAGGRICARFYRRFDGTVLTKDCNRGFKWGWQRARSLLPGTGWLTFVVVAIVAGVLGVVALFGENMRSLQAASGGMGSDNVQMRTPPSNRY